MSNGEALRGLAHLGLELLHAPEVGEYGAIDALAEYCKEYSPHRNRHQDHVNEVYVDILRSRDRQKFSGHKLWKDIKDELVMTAKWTENTDHWEEWGGDTKLPAFGTPEMLVAIHATAALDLDRKGKGKENSQASVSTKLTEVMEKAELNFIIDPDIEMPAFWARTSAATIGEREIWTLSPRTTTTSQSPPRSTRCSASIPTFTLSTAYIDDHPGGHIDSCPEGRIEKRSNDHVDQHRQMQQAPQERSSDDDSHPMDQQGPAQRAQVVEQPTYLFKAHIEKDADIIVTAIKEYNTTTQDVVDDLPTEILEIDVDDATDQELIEKRRALPEAPRKMVRGRAPSRRAGGRVLRRGRRRGVDIMIVSFALHFQPVSRITSLMSSILHALGTM
ncbi:hypothetical protein OQA88_13192 [Cercophora sp. LCS_1]